MEVKEADVALAKQAKAMDYDETLMYGQYQQDLGDFARRQAQKLKQREHKYKKRKEEPPGGFQFYAGKTLGKIQKIRKQHFGWCSYTKNTVIRRIGEDWIFLTLLGIIMALLSFSMDYVIGKCQLARIWLFEELEFSIPAQYFTWILFPIIFICFSTGFVHIVGPNAIGSGIPEMKTVLRGVVLKEYLTFRTLVSKIVGLCTSLGCGLPLGKEGPFVHIASITATLLGKLITSFRGIYENESRNTEMLAAACAVGVACTFAAPIGGVLFSIEVTATYFAVQNYWRGFYSAVCGAFVFRLLAILLKDEGTLTALFKTSLRQEFPFDPAELIAFIVIGIASGFIGPLFVYTHRKMVQFVRNQKKAKKFLQKNRFIYPSIVVFFITSITFPPGFGQFMAGQLTNHEAVNQLFSNFTLSTGKPTTTYEAEVMNNWSSPAGNVHITLVFFLIMKFWMSALALTIPVPSGVFMPVFTMGAAFGRLIGESMATFFSEGVSGHTIVPGGYAIVGAAALSGSVTHTISTSVIVFELTGQIGHVLPCVIAVLISNAIAHCLQPSFYDSIIRIKRLPYLPDIINPEAINAHNICCEDFMISDVKYITSKSTYGQAQTLIQKYKYRAFPLVESHDDRILLGSVQRTELERIVDYHLSHEKKIEYYNQLSIQKRPMPRVTLTEAGIRLGEKDTVDGDTQVHYSVKGTSSPESVKPVRTRASRFSVSRVDENNLQMDKPKSESEDDTDGILKKQSQPLTEKLELPPKPHVNWNVPFDLSQMSPEQEAEWRQLQLTEKISYDESNVKIDPAPFQLVEKTSLYKTHSLFSLLSLNHAYVTGTGRLKGIVSLKEVRKAIEGQILPPPTPGVEEKRLEMEDTDTDNEGATVGRFSINKVTEASDSEA